jgi:hypothetical protein
MVFASLVVGLFHHNHDDDDDGHYNGPFQCDDDPRPFICSVSRWTKPFPKMSHFCWILSHDAGRTSASKMAAMAASFWDKR